MKLLVFISYKETKPVLRVKYDDDTPSGISYWDLTPWNRQHIHQSSHRFRL